MPRREAPRFAGAKRGVVAGDANRRVRVAAGQGGDARGVDQVHQRVAIGALACLVDQGWHAGRGLPQIPTQNQGIAGPSLSIRELPSHGPAALAQQALRFVEEQAGGPPLTGKRAHQAAGKLRQGRAVWILTAQGQALRRVHQALDASPRARPDRGRVARLERQRPADADRFPRVQREPQLLRAEIRAAQHVDHRQTRGGREGHVDARQFPRVAVRGALLHERQTPQAQAGPLIHERGHGGGLRLRIRQAGALQHRAQHP